MYTDRESSISSTAQAIIDFDAKGMQMPQRTGAASVSIAKSIVLVTYCCIRRY